MMASMIDIVPLCRLRMRPLQFHLLTYFKPVSRDLKNPDTPLGSGTPSPQVVENQGQPERGRRIRSVVQPTHCHDRRVTDRLGRLLRESHPIGHMVKRGVSAAHKRAGIGGGRKSRQVSDGPSARQMSDGFLRQHTRSSVLYINRQGGTHSPRLWWVAWSLWMWCRRHNIQLRASHIAGKDNILADALSRGRVSQGEWELAPRWASWLFTNRYRPLVDLFATAENAKLPTFCSRGFHPRAWAVDALSFSWDGLDSYAFPLFTMIHRVLLKIRASRTHVLLIAPLWPR